jgi:hypothetical protein
MGKMKNMLIEAEEFYADLRQASLSPMTKEQIAKFEADYAILNMKYKGGVPQSQSHVSEYGGIDGSQ